MIRQLIDFIWCRHHESNAGPTDYKADARSGRISRLRRADLRKIRRGALYRSVTCTSILLITSACAYRLELVPNYSRSYLPAAESRAAIEAAAAELSAAIGARIIVRDHAGGIAVRTCTLEFAGDDMQPGIAGHIISSPCQIRIRSAPGYLATPEYVRCTTLHELGHLFVPQDWHSTDPTSFMFRDLHLPPCPITQDFLNAASAGTMMGATAPRPPSFPWDQP